MHPLGQIFVSGMTKVAHLLTPDGTRWDMNKLHEMFSDDDVNDIKQIAIGGPGTEDYPAWNYTKNGDFAVRSAYHLRMSQTMRDPDSRRPQVLFSNIEDFVIVGNIRSGQS